MTNNKYINKTMINFDNSYTRLPKSFYANVLPTTVQDPELIVFNTELAETLGLNPEALQSSNGVETLAGNQIPEEADPIAQAYAGHQFGHFNMLGDGRAILLGEQITPQGLRFDIQLKGSGRTPFSRGGDGRAALGPMLREYIISEAMDKLGIPTTRSLAVVTTGETIIRERELPGAILTRIASSHIRVGTFQYAAAYGKVEDLQALADYTINRHYPAILDTDENKYLLLLNHVIKQQAKLIAQWQMVGFIHGVMNTDNMTISGETIDYGPCAFMDVYKPETVFSSIDRQGRYAYGNQPHIAGWNLARFAETLIPLIEDDSEKALLLAQYEISKYPEEYHKNWLSGMRAKLGIFNEEDQDESLIKDLLTTMEKNRADYTNTFRSLTYDKFEEMPLFSSDEFKKWHEQWQERLGRQKDTKDSSLQLMKKNNPIVIPRNHLVEEALRAAVNDNDLSVMKQLLDVLSRPFDNNIDVQEKYCKTPEPSSHPYQTYCGT